eukprot:scaffold869_cov303-Pinguiococcus_pyrenoidosus.AAC.6
MSWSLQCEGGCGLRALGPPNSDDGDTERADWMAYWRTLFPKVTVEKIQKFREEYRDSEEERQAILRAYESQRGDMNVVLETVMCSDDETDLRRFKKIIRKAIRAGDVEDFGFVYTKSESREGEAKEAEELLAKIQAENGGGAGADPLSMIRNRRQARAASFLDGLEARYKEMDARTKSLRPEPQKKYAKPAKEPEIDEEEFQRIQARILKRRNRKSKAASRR